jgi:hypothetical protein
MKYALKTVSKNMTSFAVNANGFKWPKRGRVACKDWNDRQECGGGLHALLNGEGDAGLLSWELDSVWLVLAIPDTVKIIDLIGKVKFPKCSVIFSGDRKGATDLIYKKTKAQRIVGYTATAGDEGTATAGDEGTATAGDKGTATAGWKGTATAGWKGTATAGNEGTATAGRKGTATAGDEGTATAGDEGTATAGDKAIIQLRYWDGDRYRVAIGYIGEGGLEPGVKYKLDDSHKIIKAEA